MYHCNDHFRLLRRVYESGRAGDPNVMEELADLIGPELGKFASCGIQINAEHMLSHWLLQLLSQYVWLRVVQLASTC